LKTALVKQVLDVFGPWAGVRWKDTSPEKLFEVWPGKAVYWELTCMLEADWYVIPQAASGDYTRVAVESIPGRAEAMRKYTKNVTPVEKIPFEEYDLVMSFDAILDVPPGHPALFAYYAQEHWDRLYTESLARPRGNYDLFLAHMMDSNPGVNGLPRAISFPYLHDSKLMQRMFPCEKREAVWVEWRTLMTLAMKDSSEPWGPEGEAAGKRLAELLDLPICYRGTLLAHTYGFADPPAWGDAAIYLRELAECKYFVSVGGRIGAGQGIGEAAAAGCICIGQQDRAYHKLICHPACLCADMGEMYERLIAVLNSPELQSEVRAWQDQNLERHFHNGPLALLAKAIELKIQSRRMP
jgi:hypothetical protein